MIEEVGGKFVIFLESGRKETFSSLEDAKKRSAKIEAFKKAGKGFAPKTILRKKSK